MRMLFEYPRDQLRTFGRGHLGDVQGIDDVEVELGGLRGLAVAELEHAQRGTPSNGITIAEMCSE
jgi:hypothetical protein